MVTSSVDDLLNRKTMVITGIENPSLRRGDNAAGA
jgi:hypothetical protein